MCPYDQDDYGYDYGSAGGDSYGGGYSSGDDYGGPGYGSGGADDYGSSGYGSDSGYGDYGQSFGGPDQSYDFDSFGGGYGSASRAPAVRRGLPPWAIALAGVAAVALLVLGLFLFGAIPSPARTGGSGGSSGRPGTALSAGCDAVLCVGYDSAGNKYELVADQTEDASGYEIKVGVIKNDQWLCPMTADHPFLGERGLFHVTAPMGRSSGSSLNEVNEIVQHLYFVDTGGFLMESLVTNDTLKLYDQYYIFYDCASQESYTVDLDKTSVRFFASEPEFRGGSVIRYGQVVTDGGKVLLYTETSGTSSGWLSDRVYDWSVLDTKSLRLSNIATGVRGNCPAGVLSEGLFFCQDQGFYDLNGRKLIDLSSYTLADKDIYFRNGECSFKASNDLGNSFEITIDKTGAVLRQQPA